MYVVRKESVVQSLLILESVEKLAGKLVLSTLN